MRSRSMIAIMAAAVSLAVLLQPGFPADAAARRLVSGWIPYWSTSASLSSFTSNADLFSDVSPFWHSLTGDTTVSDQETATDRTSVIGAARRAGVRLVPTVTDGTGAGQLATALADPARRSTIVATMVSLASARGYDGIDLNLEGFAYTDGRGTWAATRPNWVAFVSELGAALRSRGLVLYATVPPTYNSNRASNSGYWVYDYAGIAPHIDRLRVMAYDYSVSSPGPIAPYDWFKQIAAYAVSQLPSYKVALGVPAYGRDWVVSVTGTCPLGTDLTRRSITGANAWTLAGQKGAPVTWDAAAREQRFSYIDTFADPTASCQVSRSVWFSDARAVTERARLIDTYRLAGIAEWTIGGEDRAQWDLLRILAANPWDPRVAPQEVLEAFVRHGYEGVLGRGPDPSGLQSWLGVLRSGAISRVGFMNGLVYSTEGSSRLATAMYLEILGRAPDSAGLVGWTNAISQRAITTKEARAGFWASAERRAKSGSTGQWVRDIYSVELGRPADPAGAASWVAVVQAQGPLAAARGIFGSQEWAQRQVAAQYQQMLKRGPDPAGLQGWTDVVVRSDVPPVTVNLGASDEYFQRGA
jgi:spore germination protein YaaH